MSKIQIQITTDQWVTGTWDEYVQSREDQLYQKAKGYYYQGELRIEMAPVGHDHASDHTIVSSQGWEDAKPDQIPFLPGLGRGRSGGLPSGQGYWRSVTSRLIHCMTAGRTSG